MKTTEYFGFVVTGVDRDGKRFVRFYKDAKWAFGINLWRGSVWGVNTEGKRKLLKRVTN